MGPGFARGAGLLPCPFLTAFACPAPRRRGLHPLGPGKVSLPGPSSFRRGSSPEKGSLPFACSVASGATRTAIVAQQRGGGGLGPQPATIGRCRLGRLFRYGSRSLPPFSGRWTERGWAGRKAGLFVSFWRWWNPHRGRRRGAKRPEKQEPEALPPAPAFLFGRPRGPRAPGPPNAAAPLFPPWP